MKERVYLMFLASFSHRTKPISHTHQLADARRHQSTLENEMYEHSGSQKQTAHLGETIHARL